MRFYLISDNLDTLTGMRLAGVEGELVRGEAEAKSALKRSMEDESIGIVLVTPKISEKCERLISELKRTRQGTLFVEIPDRHGSGKTADALTKYVSESLGIQV